MAETTPGRSQKLFKTPETFNLTENNVKAHMKGKHNDGKVTSLGSLLGLPVKLPNGIAVQTNTKTTIKLTYKGDLLVSKPAVWVPSIGNRAYQHSTVVVCWYSIEN